jgi:hypothetical protein
MHDDKQQNSASSQFPPVRGGSPEQPPEGRPPEPPPSEPAGGAPPPAQPGGGAPPPGQPQPAPVEAPPGYAPGQPGGPMAPYPMGPMQTRDSIVEWLLCAFIPFYSLYWFHRANKEMQAWSSGRIDYNAGKSLTSLLIGWIIIVPPFVTMAHYQQRIRTAQGMAGVEQRANFWGWLGRAILLSYAFKWNQDHFNEIAVRQPQAA